MIFFKKNIPAFLAVITLFSAWQLLSWSLGYPALFPSLPDLFIQILLIFSDDDFYFAILFTIYRGLIGFFISLTIALIFSTIAVFSPFWKSFFYPLVIFIRSIPVISLVLIALLWFSPNNLPVFIAFLTMFPILYQSFLNGLELTDKKLIEMAKVFGKTSIIRYTSIYLPSAKTVVFGGISSAMGFGWRAVIIGEVLSQPIRGIGTNMKQAQTYINISELIAWTVVAIAISYFFDSIFRRISTLNLIHNFNKHFRKIEKVIAQNATIKVIEINQLSKTFEKNIIIDKFSAIFSSDKVYCFKAPSGKGKTTLLHLISNIETKDQGQIKYKNIQSYAYAFQDIRLIPWLTVKENISFVVNKQRINKNEFSQTLQHLLEKTGLTEHAEKLPNELSGGQKQRVSLVRALIVKSDVLLLDEPLNGLDDELKIKIIEVLDSWISINKPLVLWATHENINLQKSEISNIFL